MASAGDIVLPGDIVVVGDSSSVILGPGLRHEREVVYASVAGVLRCSNGCKFWVENRQKKYVQAKGDRVVGVVVNELGENFRVDIGSNYHATISYLSFEGATKTNRPDIKVGDILYGRLVQGHVYMEAELVCVDGQHNSSGMGVLRDGHLLKLPSFFTRKLLSPGNKTLKLLAKCAASEVAVGVNGWVWMKAATTKDTLKLVQALTACVNQSDGGVKEILKNSVNLK